MTCGCPFKLNYFTKLDTLTPIFWDTKTEIHTKQDTYYILLYYNIVFYTLHFFMGEVGFYNYLLYNIKGIKRIKLIQIHRF